MALVGKSRLNACLSQVHPICEKPLRKPDAFLHDVGVRSHAGCPSKLPQELKAAGICEARHLLKGKRALGRRVDPFQDFVYARQNHPFVRTLAAVMPEGVGNGSQ